MSAADREAAAFRAVLADKPDAVDWLRMMELHSPLAASTRATIGRIADELQQLRGQVADLRGVQVAVGMAA